MHVPMLYCSACYLPCSLCYTKGTIWRYAKTLFKTRYEHSKSMQEQHIDVTNCDKEPIHIPGSIQPHGMLFALTEPDLQIVQASDSVQRLLDLPLQAVLHQPLATVVVPSYVEQLRGSLARDDLRFINPIKVAVHGSRPEHGQFHMFDGIVHRSSGCLVLELEPAQVQTQQAFSRFYHVIRSTAARLQSATDLHTLSAIAAQEVRAITGFDRVMIYRFDKQWNGEVIAEAKRDDLPSYLGLHYPASDIPAQARELYRRNWLRLIADVAYQPSPVVPTDNPLTGQPLDMSFSVLRSVSPMHIQYLKNMGVGASMSVSILKNGTLWGLISCHHDGAKYVPYETREACEFLGQMLSLQLVAKEEYEDYANEVRVKNTQTRLITAMTQSEHRLHHIFTRNAATVLEVVGAQGAAIALEGTYTCIGQTPTEEEIQALLSWLQETMTEDIFVTDTLSAHYPQGQQIKDTASGLVALALARTQGDYMVWFRPEVLQTVQWGGDPTKPVEMKGEEAVLRPRASFAAWSQTVRLTALPWKRYEIEAAHALRSAMIDTLLRQVTIARTEELARFNEALARSNQELDAFAYAASHDLKEPLRGISNYATILREDFKDKLGEEGLGRVETLLRLAQRMDGLIDALLHFSRVGRVEMSFARTDLNEVVKQVLDLLTARLEETRTQVRIPRPLPTVYCDRVRVGEIFSNLMSNALKYNDKAERWIEIGFQEQFVREGNRVHPFVFFVRDNGIGIREKHLESIFRIFKRLHGRTAFGGGNGVGLTIVKRIIERHGGTIWVESMYGEGTTFYFTLQESI